MTKQPKYLLFLITAWLFLSPTIAMAAHFQDYAQIVSPEIASRLEKLLAEIEEKKDLYIEEIILPSREGKPLDAVEITYTQRLEQNTSPVDKRVLLLIILDDHFVKLYTSGNLSSIFTENVSNDIIGNVTMRMTEKRYDEMARIGVAGIYHYYEASQPKDQTTVKKNLIFFLVAIGAALALAYFIPKKKT